MDDQNIVYHNTEKCEQSPVFYQETTTYIHLGEAAVITNEGKDRPKLLHRRRRKNEKENIHLGDEAVTTWEAKIKHTFGVHI